MEKIKEFIIENFLFGDDSNLANDTLFLESGIIDSTGILELAQFIETNYYIQIEDEEFVPENLNSLNNIESFIKKKQTAWFKLI